MIKTFVSSAVAVIAFTLPVLGGSALARADGTPGTLETAGDRAEPTRHPLFPETPRSPHDGQGRKGTNEQHATPPQIWPSTDVWPGLLVTDAG